jgi:hypothetical protein
MQVVTTCTLRMSSRLICMTVTGAAHTITNGIDLSGEGGLTWIKARSIGASGWHSLSDTERGAGYILRSDLTNAQNFDTAEFTSFNSNGFTVGNDTQTNGSGNTYASWTFRKAKKFFDVVTYTGNGVAGREIAHNLGSAPAVIIVKSTDNAVGWAVYHSSLGATKYLTLNLTDEAITNPNYWNDTEPTSTNFTVAGTFPTNRSGYNYVAYLFASDAGGFGDDGSESIIKCGSYTGTGAAGLEVDLGFEPQWILIKGATSGAAYDWYLVDNMRGITTGGNDPLLWPNKSDAEDTASNIISVTATGFKLEGTGFGFNRSGEDYIYIAIRRPMKTPESGTEVFNDTFQYGEDGKTAGYLGSPADLDIRIERTGGGSLVRDRLRGDVYLRTQATDAEAGSQSATWDNMTGYFYYSPGTSANTDIIHYVFKRATGFFDMVAYTGDRVSQGGPQTITHNLKVIPELAIVKVRSDSASWYVASTELNNYDFLSLNTANSANSDSVTPYIYDLEVNNFKVGARNQVNATGDTYISYLFATVAGVSKVGSYTGTAADLNVDCGFSAGARFILIKRTDSTGDWYVWDSERGIVAGNDPYLLLNSTAAEVTSTDYIDPLSSGFTVTSSASSTVNVSSGEYIFLAIA